MLYRISPDCRLVCGKSRAAIYDLRRSSIQLISLPLARLFLDCVVDTECVPSELQDTFQCLLKKQYLIPSEIPLLEIPTRLNNPSIISNCIIEYNDKFSFDKITLELQKLYCESIVIINRHCLGFEDFFGSISPLYEVKTWKTISIHIEYTDRIKGDLEVFLTSLIIPIRITLYNAPINEVKTIGRSSICFSNRELSLCSQGLDYKLILSHRFYNESLTFNNCLYKKLVILEDGSVTNCPLSEDRYGSVFSDSSLSDIVCSDAFQAYWKISKDCVIGCKDCELRYACLDCRYTKQKQFSLEKPLWCSYPLES